MSEELPKFDRETLVVAIQSVAADMPQLFEKMREWMLSPGSIPALHSRLDDFAATFLETAEGIPELEAAEETAEESEVDVTRLIDVLGQVLPGNEPLDVRRHSEELLESIMERMAPGLGCVLTIAEVGGLGRSASASTFDLRDTLCVAKIAMDSFDELCKLEPGEH